MTRRTAAAAVVALALLGLGLLPCDTPTTPGSSAPPNPLVRPTVAADRARTTPTVPADSGVHARSQDPVDPAIYLSNQRLVRVGDPMWSGAVARAHGLELLSPPGRSGLAVFEGPSEALDALAEDPRVVSSQPHARIHAASDGTGSQLMGSSDGAFRGTRAQQSGRSWHIDLVELPSSQNAFGSYVVAVLDSGVAYAPHTENGVARAAVPGLNSNQIVAPYDFVNQDAVPEDDNKHGTHIASVIGSTGTYPGIAPGVGLMPLKVLGADNSGTEFGLVEAIHHAVEHGADVINMSLSFAEGYQPSQALMDALRAAHESGVILVAASGNDGLSEVSWPAASPHVMAISASAPSDTGHHYRGLSVADYANRSGSVDLVAPGGNLAADHDEDGVPDGIVAESVNPADPSQTTYWAMAGTSQAAAVVSGLAVEMLAHGVPHDSVRYALQNQSRYTYYVRGHGAGLVNFRASLPSSWSSDRDFQVAILPYLARTSAGVKPTAELTVFENGQRMSDSAKMRLFYSWTGPGQSGVGYCDIPSGQDSCTVTGKQVTTSAPASLDAAWSVSVSAVRPLPSPVGYRPMQALTVTDAFQQAVAGLEADTSTADALIAWSFEETQDPELGSLAESYSVVNNGTGFASLPLGLVLTPRSMQQFGTQQPNSISTESGPMNVELIELDGTGLASLPLGLRSMRLVAIDGTGLASLPLGLRAGDVLGRGPMMVSLGGTGLASLPLGLMGTPVGIRLGDGGWSAGGYPVASALASSSTLGIMASSASSLDEGVELE